MPAHRAVADLEKSIAQGWDSSIDQGPTIVGNTTITGTLTTSGVTTHSSTTALTGATTCASSIKSTSLTGGIGYATGAGGTGTQTTNRATAVTMSPAGCMSGTITTDTTSLAAGASAEFTVNNSSVAIGDVVLLCQRSGSATAVAGVAGTTHCHVVTVANSSFIVSVDNNSSTTAETGAIILNFVVIKAVAA